MTDTTELRDKVAGVAVERADQPKPPTIAELFEKQKAEIAKAIPAHLDPVRLARIGTTIVKSNPKLMQCTQTSLLGALMLSAQTGLFPGPRQHAYFIPRWNRNALGEGKGAMECQWQIGYRGVIELARRSGEVTKLVARVVYEGDDFSYDYGLDEQLRHRPAQDADRSAADDALITHAYAIAWLASGERVFEVVDRAGILAAKQRSESGRTDRGPWRDDYAAMARKTAILRLEPYLPMSEEQAQMLAYDEQVVEGVRPDITAEPPSASWSRSVKDDDIADAVLVDDDPEPEVESAGVDLDACGKCGLPLGDESNVRPRAKTADGQRLHRVCPETSEADPPGDGPDHSGSLDEQEPGGDLTGDPDSSLVDATPGGDAVPGASPGAADDETIRAKEVRRHRALVAEAGIDDDQRRDMIAAVSMGRTRSSTELSYRELGALCQGLRNIVAGTQELRVAAEDDPVREHGLSWRLVTLSPEELRDRERVEVF